MDIESLKEKLGDKTFAELTAHINGYESRVTELDGKLRTVRAKADAETAAARKLNDQLRSVTEHYGIEMDVDVSTLPAAKAGANVEEIKQLEAKLKRMERERDDAIKLAETEGKMRRDSLQRAVVSDALGGHEFLARDMVETFVSQRLVWEGDDLLLKTDDGKLVTVKDGVAGIAKSRPELLKPTGTGGAGARNGNAGGGAGKTITEAEFNALAPKDRASRMAEGYTLTTT